LEKEGEKNRWKAARKEEHITRGAYRRKTQKKQKVERRKLPEKKRDRPGKKERATELKKNGPFGPRMEGREGGGAGRGIEKGKKKKSKRGPDTTLRRKRQTQEKKKHWGRAEKGKGGQRERLVEEVKNAQTRASIAQKNQEVKEMKNWGL